jgi:hypothetical protein
MRIVSSIEYDFVNALSRSSIAGLLCTVEIAFANSATRAQLNESDR